MSIFNLEPETKQISPTEKKIVQVMNNIKSSQIGISNTKIKAKRLEKYSSRLEKLGLDLAAEKSNEETRKYLREVNIAACGYTRIPIEKVKEYETDLPVDHVLSVFNLHEYPGTPPEIVLQKLEKAKKKEVFDEFRILTVVKEEKKILDVDPILVGQISEGPDFYFIAEWGNDISLKDILNKGQKKK